MILPPYVRPKPYLFNFVPFLRKPVANSIYPFIFLPKVIYSNLLSQDPNPYYYALLVHEQTHHERQKQMGILRFGWMYLFSSQFRHEEEKIAVSAGVQYLKKNNILFSVNITDKLNPDFLFLWPLSKYVNSTELNALYDNQ